MICSKTLIFDSHPPFTTSRWDFTNTGMVVVEQTPCQEQPFIKKNERSPLAWWLQAQIFFGVYSNLFIFLSFCNILNFSFVFSGFSDYFVLFLILANIKMKYKEATNWNLKYRWKVQQIINLMNSYCLQNAKKNTRIGLLRAKISLRGFMAHNILWFHVCNSTFETPKFFLE